MIKELLLISGLIYTNTININNINTFDNVINNDDIRLIKKTYNRDYNNILIYNAIGLTSNNDIYTYDIYLNSLSYGLIYNNNYDESLLYINYSLVLYESINNVVQSTTNVKTVDSWDYCIGLETNHEKVKNILDNFTALKCTLTNDYVNSPSNLTYSTISQDIKVSIYIDSQNYIDLNTTATSYLTLNDTNVNFIKYQSKSNDFINTTQVQDLRKHSYDNGYFYGYNDGYDVGYNEGYDVGKDDGALNFSFVSWLPTAIGGFLDFEIFPNFTLANILMGITGVFLAILLLKVFVGG